MRESVPTARYSPVRNVIRQWKTSLILTYRVYRLYDKGQAGSLESIKFDGAKRIPWCSSKTFNETVSGDMGLDTLQSHRDRAKLKWWYKLATFP